MCSSSVNRREIYYERFETTSWKRICLGSDEIICTSNAGEDRVSKKGRKKCIVCEQLLHIEIIL